MTGKSIGQYFIMILLVIIGIFIVKKIAGKVNIPGVSKVVSEV